MGPFRVVGKLHGNKFRLKCQVTGNTHVAHADYIKRLKSMELRPTYSGVSHTMPSLEGEAVRSTDALQVLTVLSYHSGYNLHSQSVKIVSMGQTENAQCEFGLTSCLGC